MELNGLSIENTLISASCIRK